MDVSLSESTVAVVVTVHGTLDMDSAPLLAARLDEALDRPEPRVVVDIAGVGFCDSIGLSTFVLGHSRARASGGWLRLAGPGEFLERLLDTVGLIRLIGVYPSVADAVADRPG
ncbi:STAS domain-containing protein [Actinoplanes flavus]|uniref:STAS domain-containing protein n=1 Tax=Actinoplanes flavus TaxID=2820290 RepID=UPI0027DCAC62|nr:STAS domain-containing protein [Actinoplanes flavus]